MSQSTKDLPPGILAERTPTPTQEVAPAPSLKQLYDAKAYAAAIDECRRLWQAEPHRRDGIKFLYAWSIYRHVIKAPKPSAKELVRAVAGIAALVPTCGPRDPLPLAAFAAADTLLKAGAPKPELTLEVLAHLREAELDAASETRDERTFASQRERYMLLYSKALEKAERFGDCVKYCDERLASGFAFTDKNEYHLRYRAAKCIERTGDPAGALARVTDLEPYFRQFYLPMLAGTCSLALGRPFAALGGFAEALLQNPKPAYARQALEAIARHHEAFEVPRGLAADHARLDLICCAQEGWNARDYGDLLPDIDDDGRGFRQLRDGLVHHWREWAALRFEPGTGRLRQWIGQGESGFIQDDLSARSLIFRRSSCLGAAPGVGAAVAYRARRSLDRKKGQLGWEAVAVRAV